MVPVTQITPGIVGHEACSEWFANEAFCFIGGMAWLGSMALVSCAVDLTGVFAD